MRPLRAMVDHDEALTIAASGTGYDEAGRLLEQAFRQFNGLGMAGWARRVETLQASGFDAARQAGGRLSFTYPADLTRAEVDVVRLLATGHNADDAARELGLDRVAVDELLAAALQKLGAMDVDELPRLARRYGLGGS
jgi:DNA-binding CsgD family transcriptional regulator